jgi:hypothetical protein
MRQPGLTEPLQLPNLQQWPPTLPSPQSEFPPQMIPTFDSFILQHLFFKTKFSYGADPYLGHSIGPVPTYGISNSAELQSVNKLVRQNKKIESKIVRFNSFWFFGFIPAGCHVPK